MTNGIYTDLSIEAYHANRTHLSATQIKYARQSPKHFNYYINGKMPKVDGAHFGFGNAFELALLAPDEYLQKVAVLPDAEWVDSLKDEYKSPRSTNKYKALHDEFMSANKGKYIIADTGEHSFETIEEMLSSCYQDKIIQGLIKNTEYQLSLFWTDEETGLNLKTRPDFCKRKKNVIVNVKTILDGSPDGFMRELVKYDYPLQAMMEITGCLRTGAMEQVDNYFWLVVEKVAPYNATIYEFEQEDIARVSDTLAFTLSRIKKSQEQNLFPGYTDLAMNEYGIMTAKIPTWYRL